ncbi:MAG: D-arabinose 5-phosphate isomerase, partial [Nitrospirae bacterium]|nr:D-arabinose 5-phosphate isomerase [Nitrospirota bacterium]
MRRVTTSKVAKQKGTRAATPKGGTSLDVGRRVLDIEARAVQALIQRLDGGFSDAVDLLYDCKGKVVVSGMGKSGLIGQ